MGKTRKETVICFSKLNCPADFFPRVFLSLKLHGFSKTDYSANSYWKAVKMKRNSDPLCSRNAEWGIRKKWGLIQHKAYICERCNLSRVEVKTKRESRKHPLHLR